MEALINRRNIGVIFEPDSKVAQARVWMPGKSSVKIEIPEKELVIPLKPREKGYWTVQSEKIVPGDQYRFIAHLAKSYKNAYVYDGIFSEHRNRTFGASATHLPSEKFVVFSQNHDQIGNRMKGERTSRLLSFEMQKLLAGAILLSPYIPLLFMGEEWSASSPFLYFVSHTDKELIEAVRKGRKEEFKDFHSEGKAPDPQSKGTFLKAKIPWQETNKEPQSTMLQYYKAYN